MLELFREGGWGMWTILVFGGVLLGAAVAFAIKPERSRLGFIGAMGLTTLFTTLHATWTAFGAVFNAMSDPKVVPDAEFQRTLMEGFKESTRPGAFGGFVLTLAALLLAVGILRANRRED
jgi:hypothetical protein